MATILPRRAVFVCHACQRPVPSPSSRRQFISLAKTPLNKRLLFSSKPRRYISQPTIPKNAPAIGLAAAGKAPTRDTSPALDPYEIPQEIELKVLNPAAELKRLKENVARLTSLESVPPKTDVLTLLFDCYRLANCLIFGISKGANEVATKQGEDLSEAILRDLAEDGPRHESVFVPDKEMSAPFRDSAAGTIAELIYTVLRDPKVYISDEVLHMYVRIQCLLGRPEYLPEVFHLYAHKKIPKENTSPIKYSEPWAKLPKYAVPLALAESALEAAILKKNLSLALAIVDTTVSTPAFRANRVLTRASAPLLFVTGTPIVAYAGADWVAHWQNTMDVEMSRYTAIAGALAYIGTLTTIGFVAVTTSNDQMQRVVWRPGTKLSARWVREHERAFFDRLALAWGFQESYRWGEEQGQDWQRLRDECGMRDMILDKTDLMEGMQ